MKKKKRPVLFMPSYHQVDEVLVGKIRQRHRRSVLKGFARVVDFDDSIFRVSSASRPL